MTDTADRSDNSVEPAQDDQPQAPEEAAQALSTEPLEMPEPGSAPAGFRFPSDAELMDGPNPLTDPDEDDVDDEDETGDEIDDSDVTARLDADGFPILGEEDDEDEAADSADSTRVEIVVPDFPEDFRAGFACIVGRPNAGKSTLTNAMVGTKIAITSGRPQTTRHNVRGVIHKENAQIVLVDTPGLHRPRTLLGKRLNDLVRETSPTSTSSSSASPPTRRSAPATASSPATSLSCAPPWSPWSPRPTPSPARPWPPSSWPSASWGSGPTSSRSQPSATSRSTSWRRFCSSTCRCPLRCIPPARSPTSPSRS